MAKKRASGGCIYRVLKEIRLVATGQFFGPGEIVDLSDSPDVSITWALQNGYIETADGEPVNTPVGAENRLPCPGCNEEA